MAGKKIYVKKYAGAGLTGSSSGMRFNPRDGPEMMEEMIGDIRKNWKGDLRMAHDLMRIDI